MIFIEYTGKGEELQRVHLTSNQVVEALVEEFSSEEKSLVEKAVDIFIGVEVDPESMIVEAFREQVKRMVRKGENSLTKIIEKLIAPAKELKFRHIKVLEKYCLRFEGESLWEI